MIHPLLLAAMASELQHLRSPVTVSDEMVEAVKVQADHVRLGIACRGPDIAEATVELLARVDALTAALAPAEQATICAVCGQHKHTPLRRDDMGGYVCLTCIDAELTARALTHPGGDSRIVAWRWPEPMETGWNIHSVTSVEPPVSGWQPLVPLSSLEAVERERDQFETEALQFEIVAKGLREKVVAAEASLAAAREALKPFDVVVALPVDDSHPGQLKLTAGAFFDACAALAGSNGE